MTKTAEGMTDSGPSPRDAAAGAGVTLRLLWPQWQGAGTSSVTELASEFPFGIARRGYAVGSAIQAAILPPNQGPVATAPVTFRDEGLEERDGIEAKTVIVRQLAAALEVIREHDPARIATLGGECAVSAVFRTRPPVRR
jgi:arginase